jgi:hypothetical protein
MQTLTLNNRPLVFKTKKRAKNKIPTAKENPVAFELFAGICASEKFTIEAAYKAFSGVRRKERINENQHNASS